MRPTRVVFYVALAIGSIIAAWQMTYSDNQDPKNIHYVAWKYNLSPMDPMRALATMTHDRWPDRLVLGKSPEGLAERFGFTRTTAQVSPYLRDYCAAARPRADVLFLNNSDYMVVMKNGKAVELVLCKG
jgi:hypothetical protein